MRFDHRAVGSAAASLALFVLGGSTASGASGAAGTTADAAVATPGWDGTPTLPISPQPGPDVVTGPVPHVSVGSKLRASQVIQLPSAAGCVRQLRIGFARPSGVHLRSLSAYVGAHHIIRRPVPRRLTLGTLPQGLFRFRAIVRTRAGLVRSRTRRYHHC